MKLNQGTIDRLHLTHQPGDQLHDDRVAGLRVRLNANGKATYRLVSTISDGTNRSVTLTLGSSTEMALADARAKAAELRAKMRDGVDPRLSEAAVPSLRVTLERYLAARDDLAPRTRDWYRSRLEDHLTPIADLPADRIGRDQVKTLHEKIAKTHGKPTANSAMRVARLLLNELLRVHDLPHGNVVQRAVKPFPVKPHRPIIAPEELPDFWAAWDGLDPIRRGCVALMLTTGLRSENARSTRWDHLSANVLTVPKAKSGRTFKVPLPKMTLDALEEVRVATVAWESPFIFPAHSKAGYLSELRQSDDFPYSPHMFRRTWRTSAAMVGISTEITCSVLDHSVGHVSFVSYLNRDHLLPPMREAVSKVAEYLLSFRQPG